MQPSRDRSPAQQGGFRDAQYYEIGQSDASAAESSSEHASTRPTAHLHPISLGMLGSDHVIPAGVFGEPGMAHLHYHIIPSRRSMGCPDSLSPGPACRSHSRLEQSHHHEHHHQQQRMPQPRSLARPPTSLDELAKERSRTPLGNFENLNRHSHVARDDRAEKAKNLSIMELSSISQASSKGKCQCHALQQQQQQQSLHPLRLKRDAEADEDDSSSGRQRQPPALPPRPPPRPSSRRYDLSAATASSDHHHRHTSSDGSGGCCKKYVVLCCLCGGLSAAVGSLFLAVHAVLSAHTASLALFETVPSYIPGTMLIFMGLFTMLLARRKHRYGFLMKVCGSVSVVCALVCVLVTVTTTVVHMSRLQGLRECVYTARAKSCTCYGAPQSRASDPGVLFEGTPHCEAVHGALYACLRALFGVSVAGILACIFSCMLVYQLLSHEKKKMYWEQLELRCRALYGQGAGAPGLVGPRPTGTCGCCNDCGGIGPWWAQSPGNLYTPNPDLAPSRRWRLPWSRSRGPAPSADSNYGFHGQAAAAAAAAAGSAGPIGPHHHQPDGLMDGGGIVPYGILGPQSAGAYSVLHQSGPHHEDHYVPNGNPGPYSVLEASVPLWGPPPPYSDPNSPARRPMIAFPPADPRTRLTKRIENFPMREDFVRSTAEVKRPNDNYENAEQVSNDTDTETGGNGEGRATRNNSKHKKILKGVENAAFQQQESSSIPKQSESELYFGDVSSCCGPESSLYDVATEKDDKNEGCQSEAGTSYLSSHFPKRPSSKRSRRQQQQQHQHVHQQPQQQQPQQHVSPSHPHQQQHPELESLERPSHSSCSSHGEELAASPAASYSLNASADEYEVIRQRRYGFEPQNVSVVSVYDKPEEPAKEDSSDGAYGADEDPDDSADKDYRSSFDEDMRPVKV